MIDVFKANDFKSLVDVEVNLGIVNVFIGANGSGKSNLLEAVGVLGAAASGRVNDESLMHRGVRPGRSDRYKSSFMYKPESPDIRFDVEGFGASYALSLLNQMERQSPNWYYNSELLMTGQEVLVERSPKINNHLNPLAGYAALKTVDLPLDSPAFQLLNFLENYAIYAPNTPILRRLEPDLHSREPMGLAGGKLTYGLYSLNLSGKEKIGQLFQLMGAVNSYAMGNWSQSHITKNNPQDEMILRFSDRYMNPERNTLTDEEVNEGVLYLLFCAVLALHTETPKLFAIDNFDQALNPRTARDFTAMFSRWLLASEDRQVLLTTHNPLVLDGLPLQDDRVRLFAVDRTKSGRTVIERVVVNDSLMRAAEKGVPLSQQWVMGSFGGVPPSV